MTWVASRGEAERRREGLRLRSQQDPADPETLGNSGRPVVKVWVSRDPVQARAR